MSVIRIFHFALLFAALGISAEANPSHLRQVAGNQIPLTVLDLAGTHDEFDVVPIGPSPPLDKPRVINFSEAARILEQQGIDPATWGWGAGQTVIVSRKARSVDTSELLDHLTIELINAIPSIDGELTLSALKEPAEIRIPDEPFEIIVPTPPAYGVRSRFMLPFAVTIAGKTVHQASVALEAKIMRKVWLSARRVERGEPLNEDDFYLAERDALTLRGAALGMNDSLEGYENRATLLKDRPLLQRHLEKIPVVDRGDVVDALLKKGTISIIMKVQILEKGAIGDIIRIRNPKSKRQLKGRVTHDKTIHIL